MIKGSYSEYENDKAFPFKSDLLSVQTSFMLKYIEVYSSEKFVL